MMTTPSNVILFGDCRQHLPTFEASSVDAIVTDPPYGLGPREPSAAEIDCYLSMGSTLDTGGDFMGQKWELPSVPTWRQCLRVLKPGGHLLAFAGTRTWDIMAAGIEAAGFDNKDTLAGEFETPILSWVHSQGFPKSLNVYKELKKLPNIPAETVEQWVGYGTSLKPSWEPVLVFRKPGGGLYGGRRPTEPFFYAPKVGASEATKNGVIENMHPTRKPLALMRWLVSLVAEPDQLVLDPYCGSGSTCVAAIEEGARFLGIERDPVFHPVAEKRTQLYLAEASERSSLRAGFDLMASLEQE